MSDYINIINILNSKSNITVIIILYLVIYSNYNKKIKLYSISYLIIDNYELQNNYTIFECLEENTNINANLLGGLMLIHPLLLYASNSFFIFFFKKNFKKNFFKKNFNFVNGFIFLLTFLYGLSIFLGIVWANQELFWGG